MSLEAATWVSAAATVILAVGAIITAVLAKRAFDKQAEEVRILQRQANDSAEMLRIQSDQLDAQHDQLHSLQKISEKQIEVLGLQATDLRESLAERERQAELERGYQARRVFLTEKPFEGRTGGQGGGGIGGIGTKPPSVTATAHNTSDQPIYDAELRWHMGSAGHGNPNPEPIGTLLPGTERQSERSFPHGTNLEVSGAVLRFRDAAGVIWARRPDGVLTEQAE